MAQDIPKLISSQAVLRHEDLHEDLVDRTAWHPHHFRITQVLILVVISKAINLDQARHLSSINPDLALPHSNIHVHHHLLNKCPTGRQADQARQLRAMMATLEAPQRLATLLIHHHRKNPRILDTNPINQTRVAEGENRKDGIQFGSDTFHVKKAVDHDTTLFSVYDVQDDTDTWHYLVYKRLEKLERAGYPDCILLSLQ